MVLHSRNRHCYTRDKDVAGNMVSQIRLLLPLAMWLDKGYREGAKNNA